MLSTATPLVHLTTALDRVHPSPTLAFSEKAARLRAQGRTIYQFGFGQSPFPVPEPVVEALQANAGRNAYLPVKGLPELRAAVAEFHRRANHVPLTADDVLIGPGSKELIFLLQLTCHADLIVPSPSWVSYEPQATLLGRRVTWLDTRREDRWHLTAHTLDTECRREPARPRLLILNAPNNPTGLSPDTVELERLAAVAREHRLLVLSDEIYAALHHDGDHRSIAEFYPEGTIISSGLSKWCSAGGWRLGTFCFPPALRWLLDAMAVVASETYSAVSAPIQYAAVTAFAGGPAIDRYVFQTRRVLRSLGRHVAARLRAAGIGVETSDGAYYLLVDFTPWHESLQEKGIASGRQLCDRLLDETGIGLLPGSDFGRPPHELTCRLAYVNFDGRATLAAANALADDEELSEAFLVSHCGDVFEGIDRLAQWLGRTPTRSTIRA